MKCVNGFCDVSAKLALLCLSVMLISSCGSQSNLITDGSILKKLSYEINTDDDRVNTNKIKQELQDLVGQVPQKKSWINPRTWGKSLTIYDQDETDEALEKFTKYLRNRKGFYEAQVTSVKEENSNKVNLRYVVDLGPRHYISSIKLTSPDSTMLQLFNSHEADRAIQVGDPLDSRTFDQEETRLINIAKNNGYADFNGNFIEYRGDSTGYDVDVTIYVFAPYPAPKHISYEVGDINVYTEHLPSNEPVFQKEDSIKEKRFFSKSDEFVVDPRIISKVMPLTRGSLFSRETEIRANRNLTRLSPYRFISIDPFVKSEGDSIVNYNIFLTPHEKKWIFDTGGNVFFSVLNESSFSNQDLFGLSGNVGFENRNFNNKAIKHSFGLEGSVEIEVPSARPNTLSIQLNNSFELPGKVELFNIGRLFNKVGLLTDESYKNLNYDGSSKINFSLGLTSILNFYDLNFAEASLSYTFQPSSLSRYTLKQIGVNVLETDIKPGFEVILEDNELLAKSFESYLLTGFFLRELAMFRRTPESEAGNYFSFLGTFESSGFENFLVNGAAKLLGTADDNWTLAGLEFSQFVRFEGDIRFNQKVKSRSSFAARVNFGTIVPYGGSAFDTENQVAPFVKQFFVGGPNSIRGWQLRELGPGTHNEPILDPNNPQPFFQSADIKFEVNAEYRFDLFYVFEGAVFIDAGNIWTLKEDADRPGSQFSSSFLNELAVSAGWGVRLDFDYFLFRFDFGYKLRTPYLDENGSRWFTQQNNLVGNINFAINYPF